MRPSDKRMTLWSFSCREQKPPHFTDHFILPLDEAVVVRVSENYHSSVWDLFTKAFHLPLLKLLRHAQRMVGLFLNRLRERLKEIRQFGTKSNHGDVERGRLHFRIIRV